MLTKNPSGALAQGLMHPARGVERSRRHGEGDIVLSLLTRDHGRHAGLAPFAPEVMDHRRTK